VAVLLAVLERRVRLRLGRNDVFTTVSGGLRLDEPGTDLGVALAIASSFTSRPVLERTLLVGEIALSGEIRRVPRLAARLAEAAQLGFERAGIPDVQADEARGSGIETIPLRTVADAIGSVLGEKVSPRSETPEGASREAKVP
jgi:DNA repair protein RadA/Sms